MSDVAESMQRAASASAVGYGGAGGAIISGGTPLVFGLPPNTWNVIGVVVGIVFALAGYLTSTYFKYQHLKIARAKAQADPEA